MKIANLLVRSLTLTSAILISFSSLAQNTEQLEKSLPCKLIEIEKTSTLNVDLNAYKIFESDISTSDLSLKNNSKLNLSIGELNFELTLFTDNLIVNHKLPHEVMLLGGTESSGGAVSLTIADDFIYGYIMKGGTKYFIQPLSHFEASAKAGQYICYAEYDLKSSSKEHKCGHSLKAKIEEKVNLKSVASECSIINLAIANTYDMVVKHGSAAAVTNLNLAILNNVQSDYRSEFDVNLEFNLTGHYIPSSTAMDPFDNNSTSTNAILLLPAFADWASDGPGGAPGGTQGGFGVAFDIGAVWTARDLDQDGNDIVGLAYTPGFFQILEDYTPTIARLQVLMAHEIGHNLGAGHDAAGAGTIMAPATSVTSTWSSQSVSEIDNYVADFTNLAACHTQGAPVGNFFQSSTVICQNSTVTFEDQSQYGSSSSWTFEGATTSSSVLSKPQVTFTDIGYQVISLTSSNDAGSDDHQNYVLVQTEPSIGCVPPDLSNSGGITNFTYVNINHNSPQADVAGTYENNLCTGVADLQPNATHDMRITLAGVAYVSFYFDYNGDSDFDDANESSGVYGIPNDGTYLVPVTTASNPLTNTILRMRIITSDEQFSSSCYSPSVGQVEDYGIFFGTPQVLGCTDPTANNYNPNATIDDGSCTSNMTTWYQDSDNDTYGNPAVNQVATNMPAGYVANNNDCDDTNPNINPTATELCDGIDNNCNNQTDEGLAVTTYYLDNDADGYGSASSLDACVQPSGYVPLAGDCDDTNPNINPASTEICDGIDNNCNNQTDEGTSVATYYLDTDGDGYGSTTSLEACTQPSGYVLLTGDCDDNNPNINPASAEICDGIDNNCNNQADEGIAVTTYYLDNDGDGYGSSSSIDACTPPTGYVDLAGDCDDNNPNINPASAEICDGIDNNCNNQADEGIAVTTYYLDNDGDGYGSSSSIDACTPPTGYVDLAGDCDDNNPNINPASAEICDGIDNNCNNQADEGIAVTTYYLDNDGDGYGSSSSIDACTPPTGYVDLAGDCDDNNPNINPASAEICDGIDNNCNNQADEGLASSTYYLDSDADGYGSATSMDACTPPVGYATEGGDCDDNNPAINPGQPELCDGLDNNCNNEADENIVITTYFLDEDNDGYGSATSMDACTPPVGYATEGGDCDDNNPAINPGQPELCDGLDNNCNNETDENIAITTYYLDTDNDGYGSATSMDACTPPVGYATEGGDCDDNNPAINPGQPELCDGLDNNCNNEADENITITTYFLDEDNDGYGSATSMDACTPPVGYATEGGDCDDNNPAINPGQPELCDGLDNNCNNEADENITITTYFLDEDNDGYGSATSMDACTPPVGYATEGGDCDDNNPAINPGQPELCDGLDNNCNNEADENITITTYFLDEDNDGYGSATSMDACTPPVGYATEGGDCDDNNPAINPGQPELCDGLDNNCNNEADENTIATYYLDEDGDGYGSETSMEACTQPAGYVVEGGDCDDNNPVINPGQPELCDGLDNNCNSEADENITITTYYLDEDNDGYGSATSMDACTPPVGYATEGGDCDDNNPAINPGQPELCDGLDNNCNNEADENTIATYYLDEDGDGYGSETSMEACTQPAGYVVEGGDCDDNNPVINPGQPELCDGTDNNCNGLVDDGAGEITFYLDNDNDGYGSTLDSITDCNPPNGYVLNHNDCDDNNPFVNPGSSEICDGFDNNCSGEIDEGTDQETYFLDNDGDGFGNDAESLTSCDPPIGYILAGGDCNDSDATINPAAAEPCDSIDNNCDGVIDEVPCNSISGRIYEDNNGNEYYDTFDNGIAGVNIILEFLGKSPVFVETTTDADGHYEFTNLTAGEYYLLYDISGFGDEMVSEYDEEVLMALGDGNALATFPFIIDNNELELPSITAYKGGQISGNYFNELDQTPIEGWAYLYDSEDTEPVDSIFTSNGAYLFQGLKKGKYFLEFVAPINGHFLMGSNENLSAINNIDMDLSINAFVGQTVSIEVNPGDVITNVNAVLAEGSSILTLEANSQINARWDAENYRVKLNWSLEHVDQMETISIERSQNPDSGFEAIRTFNSGDKLLYELKDNPKTTGVFYYRIYASSISEKTQISTLASVITDYTMTATVAPNPARNEVRVQYTGEHTGNIEITITDKKGINLHCETQLIDEKNYLVNIGALPSGVYYIMIKSDNQITSEKLIVIK